MTDEKMLEGIQMRLDAVPQGEWRSALGSGHNAMTAVVSDVPDGDEDYETIFICDVIPDYRVEDPQVWENRVPLLNFIQNAPTDIRFLQAALLAAEQRATKAEDALGIARQDAWNWQLDYDRMTLARDEVIAYHREAEARVEAMWEALRLQEVADDHYDECEVCQDEGACNIGAELLATATSARRAALSATPPHPEPPAAPPVTTDARIVEAAQWWRARVLAIPPMPMVDGKPYVTQERMRLEQIARDAEASFWRLVVAASAAAGAEDSSEYLDLCAFLVEWDEQGSTRDYAYRDALTERYAEWVVRARAALGGEAGEAPE